MSIFKEASVYWIRLPEHNDPATEGYIGVSKDWSNRVKSHLDEIHKKTHPNQHLIHASEKYGLQNLLSEEILTGEETFCYEVELAMRPVRSVGWNISPGGHRGPGRKRGSPGAKHNDESKKDMSVRMTGMGNSNARPDVTTEAMTEVIVQFVIDNNVHGRNILQREILNELKKSLDISIEAVRRRTKNIGNLISLVNEKLIALGLEEVKYDPYYRSEEQKKHLSKEAGWFSWVTDGTTSKQVRKSEIDKYLIENTTFRKGRTI